MFLLQIANMMFSVEGAISSKETVRSWLARATYMATRVMLLGAK